MVNEEDHIRLHGMDSGYQPDQLWHLVDALDTKLGQRLGYAFDPQRGFLTSCPTNSGTGLRISFLMHLPGLALTKTLDQVIQAASQMGLSTRGFFGEYSSVIGNFFQISNQATMGAHESEFIDRTRSVIQDIISLERTARRRVCTEAYTQLEDKVYRAYGILRYARSIAFDEMLNLCSVLRLGIETGIFNSLTIEELNELIMRSMPAHLQVFGEKELTEEECGVVRAEKVRMTLVSKTC
jgi:protein arginine kinase